jgi:predicted naringenin-chalcone synthase
MTIGYLAAEIGSSRAHVCQVLNNTPGRGMWTRRRLFPHLTEKEMEALGWSEEYNRWRRLQKSTAKKTSKILSKYGLHTETFETDIGLVVFASSTGNKVPSLESGVAA